MGLSEKHGSHAPMGRRVRGGGRTTVGRRRRQEPLGGAWQFLFGTRECVAPCRCASEGTWSGRGSIRYGRPGRRLVESRRIVRDRRGPASIVDGVERGPGNGPGPRCSGGCGISRARSGRVISFLVGRRGPSTGPNGRVDASNSRAGPRRRGRSRGRHRPPRHRW